MIVLHHRVILVLIFCALILIPQLMLVAFFDSYFWGFKVDIQSVFNDLKAQFEEYKTKRLAYLNRSEEQKKLDRLERAKREYEDALAEIELLEQIGKCLNKTN